MSLTKKGSEFEKRIKPNPPEIKKPVRVPDKSTGKGQKSEHRPKW